MRTLAAKHPDVRFVRLDFADAEMEPAGVPALLAYQGGDKFAGLVPLLQEMEDEDELNASSLEVVLRKYEVAPFCEHHCKTIADTYIQTPNTTMKQHATTWKDYYKVLI